MSRVTCHEGRPRDARAGIVLSPPQHQASIHLTLLPWPHWRRGGEVIGSQFPTSQTSPFHVPALTVLFTLAVFLPETKEGHYGVEDSSLVPA